VSAMTDQRQGRSTDSIHIARAEALFVSNLQPSGNPTAKDVAEAITRSVRAFGTRGCAGLTAHEFGDHGETASVRMHWALQLVSETYGTDQPV
jgi:hypothetical protein